MAAGEATQHNEHLEEELLSFLKLEAREDLKLVAVRYFLELTGTPEGRVFISGNDKYISALMSLTSDKMLEIARDALLTLINLSSDEHIARKIMQMKGGLTFVLELLQKVLEQDFALADEGASVIANMTRLQTSAQMVADHILAENSAATVEQIVSVLCKINFNKKATLHYLALILSNLTQVPGIRRAVLDKKKCLIQKLLSFTEYQESAKRRGGVIAALKNCCFEYDYHPWLLGEDIDILSRLLLPLAGGEEFDEDDMEKLPVGLQYLPPDKQREEDAEIRAMLIEALTQLCSTKNGRLMVKQKNAYVILRELHKWEKDPKAKLACQKLCELLISDEPQEGMEELHQVDVPAHLADKFEKLDMELLKDITESQDKDNQQSEQT